MRNASTWMYRETRHKAKTLHYMFALNDPSANRFAQPTSSVRSWTGRILPSLPGSVVTHQAFHDLHGGMVHTKFVRALTDMLALAEIKPECSRGGQRMRVPGDAGCPVGRLAVPGKAVLCRFPARSPIPFPGKKP